MTYGSEEAWRRGLEQALRGELGRNVSIRELVRKPFHGSASHRLQVLDLVLDDGCRLSLFAKDVSPAGMSRTGAAVKPGHLLDCRREPGVYLGPLRAASLGTARCYGLWERPAGEGTWLLLEKVPGRELFQWGEMEVWTEASRWLARLHARFAGAGVEFATRLRLLSLDRSYLAERMEAARAAVAAGGARRAAKKAFLSICENYSEWIHRSEVPVLTLLHGDFYPVNILADRQPDSSRICPIDWEMAAWGPGAADLAALTSGAWSPAQKSELVDAYRDEAGRLGLALPAGFEKVVQAWRLHVAVQWLSWSRNWRPPPEQRCDWLADALRIGEQPL